MKIDRQILIDLILERTGMDKKDVEAQLSELISRIHEATDKGKALEVKGFGMFYFSEDGVLTFDPADGLQTEVNFKYAGMGSVEVMKTPEKEQGSIIEEEEDSLDMEPDEFEMDVEEEEEVVKKTVETKPKVKSPSVSQKKRATQKKSNTDDDLVTGRNEKSPASTLITYIIVILIIIVGVILAVDNGYLDGLLGRDEGTSGPVAQMDVEQQELTTDDEPSGQEEIVVPTSPQVNEADSVEEVSDDLLPIENEATGQEVASEEVPLFGMYGPVQMINQRFYMIVLHSVQEESRASELADELDEEGFRALTSRIDHNEYGEMWRVGIGQFETISEAQEAAATLPEIYRENNFIGLIQ